MSLYPQKFYKKMQGCIYTITLRGFYTNEKNNLEIPYFPLYYIISYFMRIPFKRDAILFSSRHKR